MLKSIITIVTLAATPLAAEELDRCKMMGQIAATVMEARQAGIVLSDTLDIMTTDLGTALSLAAYQVPRYSTDEYQRMAITDFRNEVEVMCYGEGA